MFTNRAPRLIAIATAAMGLGLSLAPLAASAQGDSAHYRAQVAAQPAEARTMAGGVIWRCAESTCTAPRTGARPLRMCRDLQREVGQIVSFEVAGTALSAEDLARCNG